jgi:hypothetical protein
MRYARSLLIPVCAFAVSSFAQASSIVFSNFQGNSLECGCLDSQGSPLGTPTFEGGLHRVRGDEFTVAGSADFSLDALELPVGLISGSVNALDIFIYSDVSDIHPDVSPGPYALLESFRVYNQMAPFGQDAPPITVDSVTHPILTAGDSYWLLVTTVSLDTYTGWYTNNLGDVGLTGWSLDDDSLCCVGLDLRDTFAVLGTPTAAIPESSTAIMAVIGFVLFVIRTFLRRRTN